MHGHPSDARTKDVAIWIGCSLDFFFSATPKRPVRSRSGDSRSGHVSSNTFAFRRAATSDAALFSRTYLELDPQNRQGSFWRMSLFLEADRALRERTNPETEVVDLFSFCSPIIRLHGWGTGIDRADARGRQDLRDLWPVSSTPAHARREALR